MGIIDRAPSHKDLMSKRVDPETLLCVEHDVPGCAMCMVADFQDWVCEQRERRAARKAAAKAAPVDERFDVGGEG